MVHRKRRHSKSIQARLLKDQTNLRSQHRIRIRLNFLPDIEILIEQKDRLSSKKENANKEIKKLKTKQIKSKMMNLLIMIKPHRN